MARNRRARAGETAATTIELVGVSVAVLAMLTAAATAMQGPGRGVGGSVGERLVGAVVGEDRGGGSPPGHPWRASGGNIAVPVPTRSLELRPVVDPLAYWQRTWKDEREVVGVTATTTARACALCLDAGWSHALGTGAAREGDRGHVGVEARLGADARLALLAADVATRTRATIGLAALTASGRVRGIVGGTAEAEARLQLNPTVQDLEVRGGAMAGASVRAEGRWGVSLLGASIRQSGTAEGWAGAGARGVAGVHRDATSISWRLGWGAALGLGGSTEWTGSIDVSGVPEEHRRLGRQSLTAALLATNPAALLGLLTPRP